MFGLSRSSLALFLALILAAPLAACPFCNQQGQTLTGEITQASMVLYGTLTNARPGEKGEVFEGKTDLLVEDVVKKNDWLGNRKMITIERYLPPEPAGKYRYLVFFDVFKGKIDPYRVLSVQSDSNMAAYLKGVLANKDEKPGKRLRFFFDYLDNPDVEISNDALKEFANADYKEYRDMAKSLPAEKIAGWMRDPKTPTFRYGLYASLLGHCGKEEHAGLLKTMLEDPEKRVSSGIDGILAAYVMLKPQEGWEYLKSTLKDEKKEFLVRYNALRTVRFIWDYRLDLANKDQCAEAAALLLDQKDISDLAIEDLRKWHRFELIDRVLGLRKTDAFEIPIVRRAILRFALAAKDKNETAKKYVEEQKQKDAVAVADAEEILKLEIPTPKPPAPPPAPKQVEDPLKKDLIP